MARPQRKAASIALAAIAQMDSEDEAHHEQSFEPGEPVIKRSNKTVAVKHAVTEGPFSSNTAAPASLKKITDLPNETLHYIIDMICQDRATCSRSLIYLSDAFPEFAAFFTAEFWSDYCTWKWQRSVAPDSARDYVITTMAIECAGCESLDTCDHAILERVRICESCKRIEPWSLITLSKAKSEYKLNEKDLSTLHCVTKQNPHYRSGPAMRLYSVQQVKAMSDAKFAANNSTLAEARGKMKIRAQKARQTRANNLAIKQTLHANACANRQAELVAALSAKGLQLRPDSELCYNYIQGSDEWHIDAIVSRMLQMHWLHEHTLYGEVYQPRAYSEASSQMHRDRSLLYGLDKYSREHLWRPFSEYYDDLRDTAEAYAIGELEDLEKSDAFPQAVRCACGRLQLKEFLVGPT